MKTSCILMTYLTLIIAEKEKATITGALDQCVEMFACGLEVAKAAAAASSAS